MMTDKAMTVMRTGIGGEGTQDGQGDGGKNDLLHSELPNLLSSIPKSLRQHPGL
jgi:hypothetical protein